MKEQGKLRFGVTQANIYMKLSKEYGELSNKRETVNLPQQSLLEVCYLPEPDKDTIKKALESGAMI